VEEGVELVGVVVPLAAEGLGVDRREPLPGVRLGDRQVAEQERIAIAQLVRTLASVVHADRDLDAHRPGGLVMRARPATDGTRHSRQHDVVDRHAAARSVLYSLQIGQLAGRERHLAIAADAAIERRVGAERPELAPQGRGERGQLAADLAPAARRGRRSGAARNGAADVT
jgi:hypothetical protein